MLIIFRVAFFQFSPKQHRKCHIYEANHIYEAISDKLAFAINKTVGEQDNAELDEEDDDNHGGNCDEHQQEEEK